MDTSRYARFLRPGHRVTGARSQSLRGRRVGTRVGYDFAHAIVDDHSRLAFVELHEDEKAATVTAFVERALAFFAAHGIVAQRLSAIRGRRQTSRVRVAAARGFTAAAARFDEDRRNAAAGVEVRA